MLNLSILSAINDLTWSQLYPGPKITNVNETSWFLFRCSFFNAPHIYPNTCFLNCFVFVTTTHHSALDHKSSVVWISR